jgi:hypothetical protein
MRAGDAPSALTLPAMPARMRRLSIRAARAALQPSPQETLMKTPDLAFLSAAA